MGEHMEAKVSTVSQIIRDVVLNDPSPEQQIRCQKLLDETNRLLIMAKVQAKRMKDDTDRGAGDDSDDGDLVGNIVQELNKQLANCSIESASEVVQQTYT